MIFFENRWGKFAGAASYNALAREPTDNWGVQDTSIRCGPSRECISWFPYSLVELEERMWKESERGKVKLESGICSRSSAARTLATRSHLHTNGTMYYWHRNPQCSPPSSTPFVSSLLEIGQVCVHVLCAAIYIYIYAHMCDWVPGGVPRTCAPNKLFPIVPFHSIHRLRRVLKPKQGIINNFTIVFIFYITSHQFLNLYCKLLSRLTNSYLAPAFSHPLSNRI